MLGHLTKSSKPGGADSDRDFVAEMSQEDQKSPRPLC
jgi:hypothetical protein